MVHKLFLLVLISIASISLGHADPIDVDSMTLIDLQDLAVKNAASIKTMHNQYRNGEIDLKQQHFWYWAVPQVNLGFQFDADNKRITTNPNLGLNLDRFFFRGKDDRNRAKINLSNIQIAMEKETSLIRIDVKNRYDNYILLKQKVEALNKNMLQIQEILSTSDSNKDKTGVALLVQQINQLTDTVYQTKLDLNQRRNDLISVVEGNR